MRKVQEIKNEIQATLDKLSSLAKELHVSEYLALGEDNGPVNVIMGRQLAASLFGYVSGHESISADEAFEVAACISHALSIPESRAHPQPTVPDYRKLDE